jgi:hypothetical protein
MDNLTLKPCIKIENVNIVGLSQAISFRRSFNSQNKSDSKCTFKTFWDKESSHCVESVELGEKDLSRLKSLTACGDSHAKINRMILVYHTLTLPRRVWVDYDTYRIGRRDGINSDEIEYFSDSTMHTIHRGSTTRDNYSYYVKQDVINIVNEEIAIYNNLLKEKASVDFLNYQLMVIKDNLPESFLQTRDVMLTYQALRHIRSDRKNHKQPEFPYYCEWIETLPFSKQLITAGF